MKSHGNNKGFSVVELMIVLAIIGALSAIVIPNYLRYTQKALIAAAVSEIRIIERMIAALETQTGGLPASLSEIRFHSIDPWGRPYQYLNIRDADKGKGEGGKGEGGKGKGGEGESGDDEGGVGKAKARKDHFLVPVNSDYDLYSMGSDGKSVAPFTAKASRDDVVRANDGRYVGLASGF